MPGRGKLSADDRILWGKVARTTRPLHGRLEDLLVFEEEFAEPAESIRGGVGQPESSVAPKTAGAEGEKKIAGRHHPLEKPVKRKLARGHLVLEARIDLHGLVQSEAHAMLLDFLVRAHERGLRHVLVITGKGSSLGSEGALKRAAPLWFSKPEFRHLISSYEEAARQHGGEGALYVRLSRARGDRP